MAAGPGVPLGVPRNKGAGRRWHSTCERERASAVAPERPGATRNAEKGRRAGHADGKRWRTRGRLRPCLCCCHSLPTGRRRPRQVPAPEARTAARWVAQPEPRAVRPTAALASPCRRSACPTLPRTNTHGGSRHHQGQQGWGEQPYLARARTPARQRSSGVAERHGQVCGKKEGEDGGGARGSVAGERGSARGWAACAPRRS